MNASTQSSGTALSGISSSSGATALFRNKGNGSALRLAVAPGRPPLVVDGQAGKATNLNADELDGLDSRAFARGTNFRMLSNRMVLASGQTSNGSTLVPLLTLPGFGQLWGTCASDHHIGVIAWQNSTGQAVDVWHTMGGELGHQPMLVAADNSTIYTFASHTAGGRMYGGHLVFGRGGDTETIRRTAVVDLLVSRSAHNAPCSVQATATVWSSN